MDENEKWLRSHFGNDNPFTVPEGYFESLSDNVMRNLPKQEAHVVVMDNNSWKRKIVAAAASVAVVISVSLLGNLYIGEKQLADSSVYDGEQASSSDYNVVDEMANYAMLDNVDMYAYVANE